MGSRPVAEPSRAGAETESLRHQGAGQHRRLRRGHQCSTSVAARDAERRKYFQATDAGDLDRIFRDNYNWAKWTAYYNCKFTKEYRRFNEVFRNAYEAYNCVHRSAYGEYNAIHRDAYGEYNAMLDEILGDDRYQKVRDTVVALAEDRRDQIIESAQRVRDHVVAHRTGATD
jgi:hypothetical protein